MELASRFFGTLEYYGAFVTVFNEAHEVIKRTISPQVAGPPSPMNRASAASRDATASHVELWEQLGALAIDATDGGQPSGSPM